MTDDEGNWYCDRCASAAEFPGGILCELCPCKTGAFVRVGKSSIFVHAICALFSGIFGTLEEIVDDAKILRAEARNRKVNAFLLRVM